MQQNNTSFKSPLGDLGAVLMRNSVNLYLPNSPLGAGKNKKDSE